MSLLPPTKYLKSLKTPLCIYQTRKGTLLHLTPENQSFFELDALLLSLGDFVRMDSVFALFQNTDYTIHRFLGFPKKTLVLTPINAIKKSIEGINKKNAVKVATVKGFEEVTIDDFVNLATLMKPDVLVSLTEEPDKDKSGMKSHSRAVDKSLEFLDTTITELKKNGILDSVSLLGCIQGGKYEDLRKKSIVETIKREHVKGAVLYGFCEGETMEERTKMLRMILAEIPKEKMDSLVLVLHGKGEPVDVLHGLSLGVDCYEVEYPFHLAEEGQAFCFERFDFMNKNLDEKVKTISETIFDNKKGKVINLNKGEFEMDKGPIWNGCKCYSCEKHTRAYIHHLLKSKEMTANILLTIHNLHSFESFFKNVKDSISLKLFPQYVNWFFETQVEGK